MINVTRDFAIQRREGGTYDVIDTGGPRSLWPIAAKGLTYERAVQVARDLQDDVDARERRPLGLPR